MHMKVSPELLIRDSRWQDFQVKSVVRKALNTVFSCHETKAKTVSILLANKEAIQKINYNYREKDQDTNVLAFPAPFVPKQRLLGDIAVSFDRVQQEAQEKNISLEDHLMHLIIHGLLHLLGYDHEEEEEAEKMEAMEVKLLKQLNIANPYEPANAPSDTNLGE